MQRLIGVLGAFFFTIGAIFLPLTGVPLLYWLHGSQVAVPLLAGGFGALHVWQLSKNSIAQSTAKLVQGIKSLDSPANKSSAWLDTVVRVVVGVIGTVLIILGVVCFMLQNVPGLSWTKEAIASSFAGGLSALGIWYLSGKNYTHRNRSASGLVDQIAKLKELHATGSLTDEEFTRAKTRLLK